MRLVFYTYTLNIALTCLACGKPGETYTLTGNEQGVEEIVKTDMQNYPELYEGETFSGYLSKFKSENRIGRKRFKPGDTLVFPHTQMSLKAAEKNVSADGKETKSSRHADGSGKKGFGIAVSKNPDWNQKLQLLNVSWYYSWNANIPPGSPPGIEYVPMVFWAGKNTEPACSTLAQQQRQGACTHLLGYNEPHITKSWLKEPMSVEQGVDHWPHLMKTGLRLGSPAPNEKGIDWLAEFMSEVDDKGYRVDFICVHWYASGDPNHLINWLQKLHDTFDLPIWLTEFCLADWKASKDNPTRYDEDDALQFMKTALKGLESLDFVERYAWFSASVDDPRLGVSALFKEDGTLTELGTLYSSF